MLIIDLLTEFIVCISKEQGSWSSLSLNIFSLVKVSHVDLVLYVYAVWESQNMSNMAGTKL